MSRGECSSRIMGASCRKQLSKSSMVPRPREGSGRKRYFRREIQERPVPFLSHKIRSSCRRSTPYRTCRNAAAGHKKTARRRLFLQGKVAKRTGLEPATSSVTGWRSNRTELPLHNLDCRPLPCGEDVRFIYARKDSDKKKVYFCNRKRTPVFIIKDIIVLTLYLFQNDNNFPALFILV